MRDDNVARTDRQNAAGLEGTALTSKSRRHGDKPYKQLMLLGDQLRPRGLRVLAFLCEDAVAAVAFLATTFFLTAVVFLGAAFLIEADFFEVGLAFTLVAPEVFFTAML
jgi:hypothetical protein